MKILKDELTRRFFTSLTGKDIIQRLCKYWSKIFYSCKWLEYFLY